MQPAQLTEAGPSGIRQALDAAVASPLVAGALELANR
jgi:hypothetical protein